MYLGWCFWGKVSRSKAKETVWIGFSRISSDAICLRIESLIKMIEGEKLNDAPGEDGAGLLQLTAQHNCAALMVFAPIFFFLQHSIADIPFSALPEKTGVPATTPVASAKNRKSVVSHFFIFNFTVFDKSKSCQELYTSREFFYSLLQYLYMMHTFVITLSCSPSRLTVLFS